MNERTREKKRKKIYKIVVTTYQRGEQDYNKNLRKIVPVAVSAVGVIVVVATRVIEHVRVKIRRHSSHRQYQ